MLISRSYDRNKSATPDEVLGEEQKDDDATKSYCDKEITKSEKEKAVLLRESTMVVYLY